LAVGSHQFRTDPIGTHSSLGEPTDSMDAFPFRSFPSMFRMSRPISAAALAILLASSASAQQVVISQVYGGGSNTGAAFNRDFVELHNRGSTPVNITNWSLQYASATGTTWSARSLTGTIAPGGYFLVQTTTTGTVGAALPTPDQSFTTALDLSATTGKIALVSTSTVLPAQAFIQPGSSSLVDVVGYGAAPNGYEGSNPAPAPSVTLSIIRTAGDFACSDSNDNSVDFSAVAAAPRNSASAPVICTAVGACCTTGDCTVVVPGSCTGVYQGDWTFCPTPAYATPTVGSTPFEDISATGTVIASLNGTDDGAANVTLPWAFPFYGSNRTQISVGVNGLVTVLPGTTATGFTNTALPAPGTPNNTLCPLWDDLHMRTAGRVYTQALTSPDRFVIQWSNVSTRISGTTTPDSLTFQVVLFQDGSFDFRYGAFVPTVTTAYSASVGVEDLSGTVGTSVPDTTVTGGNLSLTWAPSTSTLCAPPTNDACANASTLGATQSASTAFATNDGTSSCDATGNDVWYTFTNGAAAVNLNLDTCASGTDTVITVYDACGGVELACNDDATGTPCSGPASSVSLLVNASQTIKIRVSDKGVGTSFTLTRTITIPNDPCSGAILVAIPSATAGTTVGATLDAGLPICTGPGVNDFGGNTQITAPSLWYRVNSPVNQTIYADVLNASHDSKLSVYTGSCAAPVCVTMNDDVNTGFKSKVAFQAVAGQDYYIMVHGFLTSTGTFTLTVTADATPSNDLCANAIPLAGISGSIGGTNAGATGDNTTVESQTIASCASDATHYDTWYTFTPSCSGSVTFTTCGAFDTILSVHSACSTDTAGNLIAGACNDNGAGACSPGSEVTVALTGGVPVFVRVATAGALTPSTGGGAGYTLTWAELDSDLDGTPDCNDGCPLDPLKIAAGQCGCGVVDTDTDGDLTADCNDGCPNDPAKIAPGVCGCGVSDVDTDGDLTPDCNDGCPTDPAKIAPGVCGCGVSDVDSDGDTVADCNDGCPTDPLKVVPGICGCGVADTDTDGDSVADCNDGCPNDPLKIAPGVCGCGVADTDTDGDSVADCNDGCPTDPLKIAPGVCGCGVADTDTDGDGVADCNDNCVALANPLQEDCDLDNVGNACELASGTQTDFNFNSIPDNCEPGLTVSYCTSGTSSIGCVATIGGSGVASASATAGYFVTTSGVEGGRSAVTFYSLLGPKAPPTPFGAGFLCVKSPTQRLGNLQASGTPGFCNGSVQVDVLNWAQTHPNGQGVPFTAGLTLNFQASIRDPLSPGTRVMSNAIQVTLLP
jgi:hypothetical protein